MTCNNGVCSILDLDPCDFPPCISCNRTYNVDIDEVSEMFICRACCIEWSDDDE
jgi:hypothetical protein